MEGQTMTGTRMDLRSGGTLVNALLACGILSSLVYLVTDVLASARWVGYRMADRMVSDLLAVGTPTRSFIVPPMIAYNLLIVAFAVGVWLSAGQKRSLRITAVLMGAYGVMSYLGLVLFPLQFGGGERTGSAVPHIVVTFSLVILMFLFIGFGSGARGKAFRLYSIVTILVILAGGVLAGMQTPRIDAGLPTPWLGVTERANVYASLLWVAMLAVVLLRANKGSRAMAGSETAGAARPKKKVTVLLGSPQKRGATYRAARTFLDHLESFGDVEGEIVVMSDYDIGVCRGCKVCFDRGEERCPLKDDRDALIRTMAASDGVVFASPNYSFHVSGVMKVFLDRLGFAFHRPCFHGKTASAIVVQGFFRGNEIRKYLEFCAGAFGFKVVRGSVIKTLEPMSDKAMRKMDRALAEQSRRFHDELSRPVHPAPSLIGLMAFRMSRSGIEAGRGHDSRDYTYYRDRGWFESDYYYPTHLGPFMKALGAFFDWLATHTSAFEVADEAEAATGTPSSTPAAR